MNWKTRLVLFLLPMAAFAGAGTNGGPGGPLNQVSFELTYGTFSLGGPSFNYLATNAPLVIDDDGHDLLTSISLTSGLDPRVYVGISALLGTGSIPATVTAPFATCSPSPCTPVADGTTTFSTTETSDNIAFSTGALGNITDVTDPAQIISEAELLNLISAGGLSTSTPEGSLTFTVTSSQIVGGSDQTSVTDEVINLRELDFTGSPVEAAAVPEPSTLPLLLPALVLVIWSGRRVTRHAVRWLTWLP